MSNSDPVESIEILAIKYSMNFKLFIHTFRERLVNLVPWYVGTRWISNNTKVSPASGGPLHRNILIS